MGAGFTAEIGAMRISDEIDALEVMSVPSLSYLVATRVTATLIALTPIYLISLFASFFATKLVTTELFGLSPGVYDYYFRLYLPPIDIVYSVIKMVVFTIVVTLIHCYYGYNATGGPAGVGVAVGRAIRASIVTIVVLNFGLSLLFWGDGSTVTPDRADVHAPGSSTPTAGRSTTRPSSGLFSLVVLAVLTRSA